MRNCLWLAMSMFLFPTASSSHLKLTREMEQVFTKLESRMKAARSSPRKSLDSPEKARKWQKLNLTYKIFGHPHSLTKPETLQVFRRAFKTWSKISPLRFSPSDDNTIADINIRFEFGFHGDGDVNEFDGPGGHLAHALPPPSGEIHFDAAENWSRRFSGTKHEIVMSPETGDKELQSRRYYSLLVAAVHEMGHGLGLRHSDATGSIMAASYAAHKSKSEDLLAESDVLAIRLLYGRRNSSTRDTNRSHSKRQIVTPRPNPCNARVDAAFSAGGESIYFFRGRYVWTWNETGFSAPEKSKRRFSLSKPRVNAACSSTFSGRTYIFSGHKYWRYYNDRLESGFPRLLRKHGLPTRPNAAIHIPDSVDILVMKGRRVFLFNEVDQHAKERDQNFGEKHLVHTIDAAIHFRNDTYFFREHSIWRVPDSEINANHFVHKFAAPFTKALQVPWLKYCENIRVSHHN